MRNIPEPTPPADAADALARLNRLQAALDRVNQGFTVIDTRLQLVAWNRAFFEILEFPPELAQVGTPFAAFMRYNAERGEYGPGDVEELVAKRVRAAQAFVPHYMERVRPNGQVIAVRGEPVPGVGFVTIYTDITEQRRAERLIRDQNAELERRVQERTEALARSEERLRLITDSIPALIAYFDRDRIYRFANRGYAEWFGCSKDGLVGRPVADILGARLYGELEPYLERALAGSTVSYEYSMQRGDGNTRYASSTLVPEKDAEGTVLGVFVLSSDITEQKRAQAALLQARKMEAVGQLAGGLAHDFNNMLTVVIGNLVALQDQDTAHTYADFVEPSLLAARRSVELIRRLLTFARQQPLAPQPVNAAALLHGLVRLLRPSLPENIALEVRLSDGEPFALADPHQLESALLNLALNARDAMPRGGTLVLSAGVECIEDGAARDMEVFPGDYVCISVADTGTGMDAATLARALEPFYTTKSFATGSGLGLSMVYGFARQSGGTLRLVSAPGQGTQAVVFLPRCQPAAAQPEEDTGPVKALSDRRLVLLVEDDAAVRRVVRLQLTDLGYPVIEARDGAEALRLLDAVPEVGIVLSDVVMPGGIDGRTLAAHVQALRSEVRVLLMSAYVQTPSGGEANWPLLTKPFSRQQLAAALEAYLR